MKNLNFGLYITYIVFAVYMIFAVYKRCLIVIYLNIVVVVFGGLMVFWHENIGFAGYTIGISIPIIFGCISRVKTNKINRAATLRLCRSYTEKSEVIETRS